MTLANTILALRLRVMPQAQSLGNVSRPCREGGSSQILFYRWRHRFERCGPQGLHWRRRQTRPEAWPVIPIELPKVKGSAGSPLAYISPPTLPSQKAGLLLTTDSAAPTEKREAVI